MSILSVFGCWYCGRGEVGRVLLSLLGIWVNTLSLLGIEVEWVCMFLKLCGTLDYT